MSTTRALVISLAFAGSVHAMHASGTAGVGDAPRQTAENTTIVIEQAFHYLRYLPPGYEDDVGKRWPLLLFLHGAGERGDDLELVKRHGPPKLIEQGKDFPLVVVSPQCPAGERWNVFALEALLDQVMRDHRIDPDRVYLTGLSMGGFGVWGLALRNPDRYAAIIPICGGGEARYAAALRDLPVWAFHGDRDEIVALQRSQEMVDAIRAAGGSPRFTVYPGVAHDSWTATYENPDVFTWLLEQRRAARPPAERVRR